MKISYDIVGSFLRPEEIKKARLEYAEGKITLDDLHKIEDIAISKLVQNEVQHGLVYVTDGEFRRRWWHLDWLNEFDGFATHHLELERNGAKNAIEFGHVVDRIQYNANHVHPEIEAYDFLQTEAKKYADIVAKKCISGPNMILVDHYLQMGIKDTPYYGHDINMLIDDIALAYQNAIQDFYDHGCRYLQIDDTSWTYLIDGKFVQRIESLGYTKQEVLGWFEHVTAKSLENKPQDMTIATHFCKGNFKGNPLFSGFYDSIASIVASLPFDAFFVEYDDERSGSFDPWQILKGTNKIFVAGLISTKNAHLESYEDIKKRYLEAKSIIGDNIALSPQCGFASVEEGNNIDEQVQWEKIDLLVSCKDFL